jgi:hypothetical protein
MKESSDLFVICWESHDNNQDFKKLVLLQGLTSVVKVDFALD